MDQQPHHSTSTTAESHKRALMRITAITDWARKAKATPFSVSTASETMMLHET